MAISLSWSDKAEISFISYLPCLKPDSDEYNSDHETPIAPTMTFPQGGTGLLTALDLPSLPRVLDSIPGAPLRSKYITFLYKSKEEEE